MKKDLFYTARRRRRRVNEQEKQCLHLLVSVFALSFVLALRLGGLMVVVVVMMVWMALVRWLKHTQTC
jgi:hypothetical protein